ncbi:DUF421 domain-containing protein [Actinomadura barringtoniae]|uniref:DUF421 domain-containing protein n=1 Tax=Actinomadura barringtoniae TaxID=1427535 RepID=A0A939PH41_9ACTN|nr:DUF421 domain-containing protein [Actinomadura barringtoniae]MBO2449654.1 DUF421 domain-containing protein [Actinomadura barringtoniae]
MWHDLFSMGIPVLDKIVRTVAVFLVVAALLRFTGKREMAQLNGFDFVVMLLLSNVVQNAIIGPDNSLWGGILGAVVLLAANAVLVRVFIGRFDAKPIVLARDGAYVGKALRRLALRQGEVDQVIQAQGGDDVADVDKITLEPGGAVVVRLRHEEQSASYGDVEALNARLDRIERLLEDLARRPRDAG